MLKHQPSLQSRSQTCQAHGGRAGVVPAPGGAKRQRGFTLIELMIAVAVVAVLAAFALPSYQEYVKRGQIVDGIAPLADMGAKMEQYFQDKRKYTGACASGTVAPLPANTARFDYSCNAEDTLFTITATGKGPMAGFAFTLNQSGTRATTSVPSGWTAGTACWSVRKDGGC